MGGNNKYVYFKKRIIMEEYQDLIKKTKKNIELTQQMFEEIERWEQKRFEKKALENTDNFWTCE
jgi:hypothetical protein